MLCCIDSFGDPQKAYNRQTSDGGVAAFPGQRRFQSTGGNALAAAPPSLPLGGDDRTVAVIIPPGVQGGQQIQVQTPDGQTVQAHVPPGMSAGQQFLVRIPPRAVTPSSLPTAPAIPPQDYSMLQPVSPPRDAYATPVPDHKEPWSTTIPATRLTSISSAQASPIMTDAVATPVYDHFQGYDPVPPPRPQALPSNNQKIMKVQVPPGVAAGSILHVQVPGGSRTIAAQVPPGVSEFHVAYDDVAVAAPPQPPSGQKLLLVRVPPGTQPGTAIHVAIPDEPGRVISATVPPNVSEFHVSYVPQRRQHSGAGAQRNTPLPNYGMQNGGQHMPQPNNSQNSYNPNPMNQGGMGGYLLPLLGGAALGAAGMSMFDHYGHQQYVNAQDTGYGDTDNGNDAGGFGDY